MRVSAGDLGIGVDQRTGQARDRMQQSVLGADRELMRLHGADVRGNHDLAFGPELMADPPHPHLPHPQHTRRGPQHVFGLINQRRVHRIHQPPVNLPRRLPQNSEDRHRDHQADHWVGPVPAQRHPARPQQHRQRRQPIGTRMQPVRDQRRRPDPAPGADPVPCRQLVPREPSQRRHRDRDQIRHMMRMNQAGHRLIRGQRRGRRDRQHGHDPRQVLRPAKPIGVPAGRRPAAQHERHPQRHGRQRIRRVMQRVTQ